MTNLELAGRARLAADEAMRDRRAWLCVAVVLAETRTITAARKAVDDIPVPAVRDRAGQLLAELLGDD